METWPRISHMTYFLLELTVSNLTFTPVQYSTYTHECLCNETLIKGNLRHYANELRSDPVEHGVILNELMASPYSLICYTPE